MERKTTSAADAQRLKRCDFLDAAMAGVSPLLQPGTGREAQTERFRRHVLYFPRHAQASFPISSGPLGNGAGGVENNICAYARSTAYVKVHFLKEARTPGFGHQARGMEA